MERVEADEVQVAALDIPAASRTIPRPGYSAGRMAHSEERDVDLSYEQALARVRSRLVASGRRRWGADAEDLAHETLLLLTTKYARVQRIEEMVPLAITILHKLGASRWRTLRRRGENEAPENPPELVSEGPSPEVLAARQELLEQVAAAAAGMSGRCREILRLQLLGYRSAEMQRALGARSVGTVDSWKSRCFARLREILKQGAEE